MSTGLHPARRAMRGLPLPAWLAPPRVPGDEFATRRAELLHVALWSFVASALLAMTGSFLGQRMPDSVVSIQAASLAVGLGLLLPLHRGDYRTVALGLLLAGWATITSIVATLGTIRAPVMCHYLLCVTLGGIEFGAAGLAGTIALCSATVGALVAGQNLGYLPEPDYTTNSTQWVSSTALFLCMGWLTHGCTRLLEAALDRAGTEITRLAESETRLRARIDALGEALEQVRTLGGLLPLCGSCGKVREDDGYWQQLERFVESRTDAQFTHGICPDCRREHFPRRSRVSVGDDSGDAIAGPSGAQATGLGGRTGEVRKR